MKVLSIIKVLPCRYQSRQYFVSETTTFSGFSVARRMKRLQNILEKTNTRIYEIQEFFILTKLLFNVASKCHIFPISKYQ